ncbi:hypothetical protein [Pyrococcus horikoshii]|uniref:Uncharacterized protein n=1 Tax=Pyrococcus horikoshii TaxID=53953 RepID=A0A832T1V4_PYRHR|nr:hypothetical protein [Pyrococcus horikoshii]HII61105.1 hypothetical protein [Pyrococcus horikoshii]
MEAEVVGYAVSALVLPFLIYYMALSLKSRQIKSYQTWAVIAALFLSIRGTYNLLIYLKVVNPCLLLDKLFSAFVLGSTVLTLINYFKGKRVNKK